jgi:hypothetical protein
MATQIVIHSNKQFQSRPVVPFQIPRAAEQFIQLELTTAIKSGKPAGKAMPCE